MTASSIPTYDEATLRSLDVHEFLPQQEPFVMIGTLVAFGPACTVTETVVSDDNLFVDDHQMSASGLIENMAQTCAVRIGFINKMILKSEVQIGFIGAIRDMHIDILPHTGDTITTTVEFKESVFGMTLASANIVCGQQQLASAIVKIAIKEDKTE